MLDYFHYLTKLKDKSITNYLILTGTTIEKEYGNFQEIEELKKFEVLAKLKVEEGHRTTGSMARTTANAIRSFSGLLEVNTPDLVLLI